MILLNLKPQHYLIRLEGVDSEIIDNEKYMMLFLRYLAKSINATVMDECVVKFDPQGLTGVIVLAESHISFHSFPEYNLCYLDIFTCTDRMDALKGVELIRKNIPHSNFDIKFHNR